MYVPCGRIAHDGGVVHMLFNSKLGKDGKTSLTIKVGGFRNIAYNSEMRIQEHLSYNVKS